MKLIDNIKIYRQSKKLFEAKEDTVINPKHYLGYCVDGCIWLKEMHWFDVLTENELQDKSQYYQDDINYPDLENNLYLIDSQAVQDNVKKMKERLNKLTEGNKKWKLN